jgi:hypothetical protein
MIPHVERPAANGGHGLDINDPRGGPADFRTIGVRLRLSVTIAELVGSRLPD